MKISEQWLREWVDPPVSNTELVAQLTMAGLEVDSVEPAAPAFNGVVTGRVVALEPHPNADRLRLAQVDIGQTEPLQIICGAPNVQIGMIAPTALIGAELPGPFKVEPSELRGIVSQGMLCSAKELGLAETSEGLLALPSESSLGRDVRVLLGLDDQIIDIDLTPNRGDCLGIAGVAREVGVLNRCEVLFVKSDPVEPVLDATFPVVVSAPADCPRYVGRVIRGINPGAQTPLWLRERLRRAGLRPLGPLVDVTNYVMLELGQPMHAFDLDRLSECIEVRRAVPGETLDLLNGMQVKLDVETLLIADQRGPIAMAGIMGGEGSAVDDGTQNVFLESAFFTPSTISGRARRYGLHTDSSHRFERGVDPQLQVLAMERATRLLLNIAGGQAGPIIEAASEPHLPVESAIRLRLERIQRLLGIAIDPQEISEILLRLGMAVAEESYGWLVVPPAFRFDIAIEADLIEEIGRIYGYDRLPSARPLTRLDIAPRPENKVNLTRLRETLVQRGFQEAITYSFVDPSFQKVLDPERESIFLVNPISADLAVMRTSLWPGLVKALLHNQKRQQSRIRLFECGLNFVRQGQELRQDTYVGGVACGEALPEQWGGSRRAMDFFDLKGDVEALLMLTGQPEAFSFQSGQHPALHPGRTARIENDQGLVGWIGVLHPAVERALGLEDTVFVFELRASAICKARIPHFEELSKYPASRRDIAIVVDESVTAQAVRECIRNYGTELLREIHLFDVYRGESIGEGRKSMAFGLILQDFSSNLTDLAVDTIISKIITGLEQQLGATLRV